jgi:hypothetical protein
MLDDDDKRFFVMFWSQSDVKIEIISSPALLSSVRERLLIPHDEPQYGNSNCSLLSRKATSDEGGGLHLQQKRE